MDPRSASRPATIRRGPSGRNWVRPKLVTFSPLGRLGPLGGVVSTENDECLAATLGPAAARTLQPLLNDVFGARFHRPGADRVPGGAILRIPHARAIGLEIGPFRGERRARC